MGDARFSAARAWPWSGPLLFPQRRRFSGGRAPFPPRAAAGWGPGAGPQTTPAVLPGAALDLRSGGAEDRGRETRPPNRGRLWVGRGEQERSQKAPQGPYLCRRFLRFLVWFKADLDVFRSLEETSSESEKRAEAHAAECGARWAAPRNARRPKPARAPPGPSPVAVGACSVSPGRPPLGRPHP